MPIVKIKNSQAVEAHKLMHDLDIPHDAPELSHYTEYTTLPDNDYIRFNVKTEQGLNILKSNGITLQIKRGLFWRDY